MSERTLGNISNDNAAYLQGIPVSSATPAAGDVLQFNSTNFDWEPKPVSALPSIQSIQNVGTGQGHIWSNTTAGVATLKSLVQGTDITITEDSNNITINATGTLPSGGVQGDLLFVDNTNTPQFGKTINANNTIYQFQDAGIEVVQTTPNQQALLAVGVLSTASPVQAILGIGEIDTQSSWFFQYQPTVKDLFMGQNNACVDKDFVINCNNGNLIVNNNLKLPNLTANDFLKLDGSNVVTAVAATAMPNIYTADGTITDPTRVLDGNGSDLFFANISTLETDGAKTHINASTEAIITTPSLQFPTQNNGYLKTDNTGLVSTGQLITYTDTQLVNASSFTAVIDTIYVASNCNITMPSLGFGSDGHRIMIACSQSTNTSIIFPAGIFLVYDNTGYDNFTMQSSFGTVEFVVIGSNQWGVASMTELWDNNARTKPFVASFMSVDNLSNTNISSPANGQLLIYSGGNWINSNAGPSTNIYNTDGTLTGNRIMTGAGNLLILTGVDFAIQGLDYQTPLVNTLATDAFLSYNVGTGRVRTMYAMSNRFSYKTAIATLTNQADWCQFYSRTYTANLSVNMRITFALQGTNDSSSATWDVVGSISASPQNIWLCVPPLSSSFDQGNCYNLEARYNTNTVELRFIKTYYNGTPPASGAYVFIQDNSQDDGSVNVTQTTGAGGTLATAYYPAGRKVVQTNTSTGVVPSIGFNWITGYQVSIAVTVTGTGIISGNPSMAVQINGNTIGTAVGTSFTGTLGTVFLTETPVSVLNGGIILTGLNIVTMSAPFVANLAYSVSVIQTQ